MHGKWDNEWREDIAIAPVSHNLTFSEAIDRDGKDYRYIRWVRK